MKRILITVAVIFLWTSVCFGQVKPPDKDQSNIEKFSAKSGVLIEKSIIDLGKIQTAKIQLLTLTDLNSNAKISGFRFELYVYATYGSDTKIAFLDQDEVDGLVKSLTLLKNNILTSTRDNYTEVIFTSRTGFSAGAYFDEGKWNSFMKLEKYDGKSYVYLKGQELDTLLILLQQAKEKLIK